MDKHALNIISECLNSQWCEYLTDAWLVFLVPASAPQQEITTLSVGWKEGNVLFNDALNTFYLRLYGVGHMV